MKKLRNLRKELLKKRLYKYLAKRDVYRNLLDKVMMVDNESSHGNENFEVFLAKEYNRLFNKLVAIEKRIMRLHKKAY